MRLACWHQPHQPGRQAGAATSVSLLTALDYRRSALRLEKKLFLRPAGCTHELRARTHNFPRSTYTIEAARTSTFAQQCGIVCGQLGPTI